MQRVEGTNELHLLEHYHPNHNSTPNHANNHNHNHHYHPNDLLLLQQQQEQQRHRHLLQHNASFPLPPMFNTSSCFPLNHTTHSYNYNNNYGVSGEEDKPECGSSEYAEDPPHPMEPLSSMAQLEAATAVGQEKRKGKRIESGIEMDRTEKREREKASSSSPPAAKLLEELAKRLMEQQEALHQKLMEKVEKQEEERAQREEAYLRREEARSKREHDRKAEEYTIATERDAAILAFLHRLTSQNPVDSPIVNPSTTEHYYMNRMDYAGNRLDPSNSKEVEEGGEREIERERGGDEREKERDNSDHSHARRWPKMEVHGLIRVRSEMEPRFQEAGPKAHLWEEVSNALASMGFERSAKRCKEKWENINKYFRKTKDSCRKRPDNAKTCPYFHQLELLYNRGILSPPILAPSTNIPTNSTTNTTTITSTKPSNKSIPTSFYLNNNIIINSSTSNNNNNNNNNNDSIYPRREIGSEGLVRDILMHQKLLDHEYLDAERVPEQLLIRGQHERKIHPLSSSKLESVSFMNLLHSAPLQNQDFHM